MDAHSECVVGLRRINNAISECWIPTFSISDLGGFGNWND